MKKDTLAIRRKAYPSVSILIPTDKRYPGFKNDQEKMNSLLKQTEDTLLKDFPSKKTKPLIKDMYNLAAGIDYRNLSDGLGLFVSPYREKLVLFPFPVKEKVIIDRTFELRDLLFAAKNDFNYAVITISEKKVRIFHGFNNRLVEEKYPDMPYNMNDVGGKGHSRVGTFTSFSSSKNVTDQKAYAERKLEKYTREIDRVISANKTLKKIPLVIAGPKRLAGHFHTITKNTKSILGYVNGNFDRLNEKEIYTRVSKLIGKRLSETQKEALGKLEEAVGSRKAVSGIRDVWKAAYNKQGRLLLVEKDFYSAGKTGKRPSSLISDNLDKYDIHYMNDSVDDVIELVLKYGGNVVFVDNGKLEEHGRIALITYF